MLLELALMVADVGAHSLVMLQKPFQPARGFMSQLLQGFRTELVGELLKLNRP